MNLPLNLVITPVRGYLGVLPRYGIITAGPFDSKALANPLGRSPGSFAKRRKHSNGPVSGANFCSKSLTKPVNSLGVAWGSATRAGR